MHEASIVSTLMARVEAEAAALGAVAVHRVKLQIGELSGVESELLESAFLTFRERSICAAAELEIVPVPASWSCPACATALAPHGPLRCGVCGGPARLTAGDEIILERIEMEVPDV